MLDDVDADDDVRFILFIFIFMERKIEVANPFFKKANGGCGRKIYQTLMAENILILLINWSELLDSVETSIILPR